GKQDSHPCPPVPRELNRTHVESCHFCGNSKRQIKISLLYAAWETRSPVRNFYM
ncbi:7941_t:CDS:1, partial [Gigaspora rosea]